MVSALAVDTERTAEQVAALSKGRSASPILEAAVRVLGTRVSSVDRLVDVGCGAGDLFRALGPNVGSYLGVDLVRYKGFPSAGNAQFISADLNNQIPLEPGSADVVVSIETIEHIENPRAFMRELVRVVRPGGLILITTPNQLSLLSKLTLVVKDQFNAFTETNYPAHITALLEGDLRRIAIEVGLEAIQVTFTDSGRIPGTSWKWPQAMLFRGRRFSDNILVSGKKRVRKNLDDPNDSLARTVRSTRD